MTTPADLQSVNAFLGPVFIKTSVANEVVEESMHFAMTVVNKKAAMWTRYSKLISFRLSN